MTDVVATPRDVAARIAARAELRDVRLLSTTVPAVSRLADPPLVYHLSTDVRVEHEDGDETFVVACSYEVTITEAADGAELGTNSTPDHTSPSDPIARLQFDFATLVSLHMRDGDEPASDEELQAYATSTGQFALYPYARQYIYDLTGRLGLPALTVGVLQLDWKPPHPAQ